MTDAQIVSLKDIIDSKYWQQLAHGRDIRSDESFQKHWKLKSYFTVFDFLFVFELHRFLFDIFDKDNDKILLNVDDDVDNDDDDGGRSFDKKQVSLLF